jgi:hypothetical protein
MFGRVIYPQHNLTTYYPLVNHTANVNYSNVTSSSKTFTIYTYNGLVNNTGATSDKTFTGYRWHVTSYTRNLAATDQIFNGLITFDSNFLESDLEEGYNGSTYVSNPNPYLVVLIGIDSTGSNSKPDKFLYITGSSTTWGSRIAQTSFNFNGVSTTKKLRWSLDAFGNSVNVKKIWLFVGYKDDTRGKQLWMKDILSTHP